METSFIFVSILFGILFISLDLAFFNFRKKTYSVEQPSAFSYQTIINRLLEWLRNYFIPRFNIIFGIKPPKNVLATNNAIVPSENSAPTAIKAPSVNAPAAVINSANKSPKLIIQEPTREKVNHPDQNKPMRVQISADIPAGSVVTLTLKVERGQEQAKLQKTLRPNGVIQEQPVAPQQKQTSGHYISKMGEWFTTHAAKWNFKPAKLDQYYLLAAILIYALVVSIGISRYPIYFFTDEAIHMNLASNFLRDGYKNYFGEFLPTFFTTEGWVNGVSVYVQVLPFILFGKSVIVTRLVSAFISLLGALAVGLLLKDALKLKYYWAGVFMVLTTPAWFLHARTAFEYVEIGSFYSIFLYFYSRYRTGHLRSLYWAIIAGALTFYTHGLGQILMGVSGLALFIVDFRYHIHPDRRKTVLYGLLLGTILLLPFARYYLAHPGEAAGQVKRRGSYWVNDNLNLLQKLGEFVRQYLYGLNPSYWFFKNPIDLNRHTMNGYGNGLWVTIPLLAVGLFQVFKNIRLPSYRIILISLLVSPIPASVVAIGMPRMLWMTIPVAILSVIGLSTFLQWLESRWRLRSIWLNTGGFIILAGLSFFMLTDALVNGPTWFDDYSLYGMQYGAKQVFQDEVRVGLEQDPQRRYIISPSWANGTEQFVAFFIPEALQYRVSMGQPENFIAEIRKGTPDMYFVATSNEYDKLIVNPEFKDIVVYQILPFPNGKPGFYVLTLNIADNIEEILTAEHEKNRKPVEASLTLNGQSFRVLHSPLGSGRMEDVFDNNPDTLAMVIEANPFIFDLYPTTPIVTNGIVIQTGSLGKFTVTISLYAPKAADPVIYTQTFANLPPDPLVTMTFGKGPATSARIYIEIKDDLSGVNSQIHIRTIEFK
jgi:hypothetical protein